MMARAMLSTDTLSEYDQARLSVWTKALDIGQMRCFPFYWAVVARVVLCTVHSRLVSTSTSNKLRLDAIFDACYYGACLQIFLVVLDQSLHLRITSTELSDNFHKWGVVETVPTGHGG